MGEEQIVVVGSSFLLASYPDLGEAGKPMATSYDVDVIPEPFDEDVGIMIHEALGEDRRFHLRHDDHTDVIRSTMFEQFSAGWRDRYLSARTSVVWNRTISLRERVRLVVPKT
jgi:hypothetical protein